MQRDQITQAEAEAILDAQLSREARLQLADDLILNIDAKQLPAAVKKLHQQYLQLANLE
jgi:dephospho-CoA kinase